MFDAQEQAEIEYSFHKSKEQHHRHHIHQVRVLAIYISVNIAMFVLEISHGSASNAPQVAAYTLGMLGIILFVIDLIMIYWFVTSFGRFVSLLFPKTKS